jgi:hypothetical protein
MHPAIRAIPTFGTCLGVTTVGLGINQPMPNILLGRMVGMIWTGRTTAAW